MFKACIFDLDGTLVDSLRDLADASNHALHIQGYPTHETAKYRYFVGNGIPKLIERTLPVKARTPDILAHTRALFDAYYDVHRLDHTAPYPGILPLLDQLGEKGIPIAIVSNKADPFTKKIASALFGNRFQSVLGSRPNVPRKPDPTAALEIASNLNTAPEECLFIGDSGVDMKTATAAGMTGIGVLWGFRGREELLENGAHKLIEQPAELLSLLQIH